MVNQVVHNNNPADATKSLTDTYALDPNAMRRPASITVTTPAAGVRWASGGYAYDGAGNVTTIGQSTFAYDLVSRLKTSDLLVPASAGGNLIFADGFETGDTSCWEPGTNCQSGGQMLTQAYTFDAFGNLLAIGGAAARNLPTSSTTNHLTGAGYDASGNLTSWNGNLYQYDPFHLMWDYRTATDEWVYLYTADDERAWSYKTDNPSLWTLRGPDAKVLREYSNNGTWSVASDYINRDGSLLAAETPQGIRHFHLDHLGTPRLISDGAGNQTAFHVYFPFGEEATAFNQDTIRAKFTGHERDLGNPGGPGDDLDYMHARYCSPLTGRFLSVDSAGADSALPQSWNRFSYARGNPLILTDPDGEFPFVVVIAVAVVAGALTSPEAANAPESASAKGIKSGGAARALEGALKGTIIEKAIEAFGLGKKDGKMEEERPQPKPGSEGGPGAGKKFSEATKQETFDDNSRCVFCGKETTTEPGPDKRETDHAIPKSRGGNNSPDNAQTTCRTCNRKKGTMTSEELQEKSKAKPPA